MKKTNIKIINEIYKILIEKIHELENKLNKLEYPLINERKDMKNELHNLHEIRRKVESLIKGVLEILCQSDRIYSKGLNNESNI